MMKNPKSAIGSRQSAFGIRQLGIVEEEADESLFWLELVVEANLIPASRVEELIQEADELTAIFVASRKTAKGRK